MSCLEAHVGFFFIAYEGDVRSLCTETIWQKVDFFISNGIQIEKCVQITINLFVLQLRHAKTDTKNVYRKFLKTWFFCGGSFAAKVRKNTQKVVSYFVKLDWRKNKQ